MNSITSSPARWHNHLANETNASRCLALPTCCLSSPARVRTLRPVWPIPLRVRINHVLFVLFIFWLFYFGSSWSVYEFLGNGAIIPRTWYRKYLRVHIVSIYVRSVFGNASKSLTLHAKMITTGYIHGCCANVCVCVSKYQQKYSHDESACDCVHCALHTYHEVDNSGCKNIFWPVNGKTACLVYHRYIYTFMQI